MGRIRTLWITLLALPSCTGSPQPEPVPFVEEELLRGTALCCRTSGPVTGTIRMLGLPGCVSGAGTVRVEGATQSATAVSNGNGSFVLAAIRAQSDEQLAVQFEASAPAHYSVKTISVQPAPPPRPHAIPGVPPIASASQGRAVLRGMSGQERAGQTVIVENTRSTELATAVTDGKGQFQIEVAAQPGDTLRVFDDGNPLSNRSWDLVVP